MIRWDRPIEWDDGTDATVLEEFETGARVIASSREPRGWDRSRLPPLGPGRSVTVSAEGATDVPGAPRLRNVDMPDYVFLTGADVAPSAYALTNQGEVLRLTDPETGKEYCYAWPGMQPITKGAPPVREISREEKAVIERSNEQLEELQDNGLWGMF